MIVSVIAAFVVGMEDYPIIFFVFLIGIPALSCISTVFLVAIGDLFENVYNTRYDIRDIKKTIEKMSKEESK